VTERAVINASPLILLSRGGYLELLRPFADRMLVPEPVVREIRAKGFEDVSARALDSIPWLECVPTPKIPDIILAWGLGPGESFVLAMAQANPGMEAIIDDLAARKCAALLAVPLRGTLGIVLAAKRRGYIDAARPVMEKLIKAGLYLSRTVLDEALRRVDE